MARKQQQPQEPVDRTRAIVRANLARIKLVAVAGTAFCNPEQKTRLMNLLYNRNQAGGGKPVLMAAAHRGIEESMFERFAEGPAGKIARIEVVRQADHSETVGNALALYRREIDAEADDFTAKRHCLFLSRRGGKGTPRFISPFTGGGGTTCGEWTRVVQKRPNGTLVKGFMKAAVAVGFCPVECPYCYLQMPYTEGMDIALNWEDLADELRSEYRDYPYPINFGEASGLVEYDEWLAGPVGFGGSVVQFVIDACAAANVTPFFLTKIRYPRYLRFHGKVQVGISLMPEPIREWLAPHGSPADELLDSLGWAVKSGAQDPVIRMTVLWQSRELYPELLKRCREVMGASGWRLTLDILRFTPGTARTISARYPDAVAGVFAAEISPGEPANLGEIARRARGSDGHVKKIRPPVERQAEIYSRFRDDLNRLGCRDVLLTPCKGDPEELLPLVRSKTISAMPCACYGVTPVANKPGVMELPMVRDREARTTLEEGREPGAGSLNRASRVQKGGAR